MKLFLFSLLTASFLLILGISITNPISTQDAAPVIPKVSQFPLPPLSEDLPTEIADFIPILYALEKYKIDHRQYPISSRNGKGFDGIHSDYAASSPDWIAGLVPTYIDKLPRDRRNASNGRQQYLYSSNGAHYKLIAHQPDNCEEIKKNYPMLIDPARNCWAFGFWTSGAAMW